MDKLLSGSKFGKKNKAETIEDKIRSIRMYEENEEKGNVIIRRDFMKGTILGALGLVLKHTDSVAQVKVSAKEFVTQSGVEMFQIPSGWFTMGDKEGDVDEIPHKVYIDSFNIDKYLVTQEEYEKIMGENIARWKGKRNPVEQVRWSDAVMYCNISNVLWY